MMADQSCAGHGGGHSRQKSPIGWARSATPAVLGRQVRAIQAQGAAALDNRDVVMVHQTGTAGRHARRAISRAANSARRVTVAVSIADWSIKWSMSVFGSAQEVDGHALP
jgi:hypothetical protein